MISEHCDICDREWGVLMAFANGPLVEVAFLCHPCANNMDRERIEWLVRVK